MEEINYKKSTGIIIQDELGRVLWLKRKTNGLLTLPGGKCNPDETFRDCATRELAEETGITGLELEFYSCTKSFTNGNHWKEQTYIAHVDSSIQFKNMEPELFEYVKFFTHNELPDFPEIEKYDHELLKMLRGERERQLEH